MLALSIRQPWASLIMGCGKDIENRNWKTPVRGRILVHAAKGCTKEEFADARAFASIAAGFNLLISLEDMPRGGIIGSVEIVDCVSKSNSRWFIGEYGFVLRDPKPITMIPHKGQLGFFNVPDSVVRAALVGEEKKHSRENCPKSDTWFANGGACGKAWDCQECKDAPGRKYKQQ